LDEVFECYARWQRRECVGDAIARPPSPSYALFRHACQLPPAADIDTPTRFAYTINGFWRVWEHFKYTYTSLLAKPGEVVVGNSLKKLLLEDGTI